MAAYVRDLASLGKRARALAKPLFLRAQRDDLRGVELAVPLTNLANDYRERAQGVAAGFLLGVFGARGIDLPRSLIANPPALTVAETMRTFDYVAPGMYGIARAKGLGVGVARDRAVALTGGTVEKYALAAARETVEETASNAEVERIAGAALSGRVRIGWARVTTSARPCSFCVMLASRGAVYATERSAKTPGGHQYHVGCECIVVPVVNNGGNADTPQSDEYYQLWLKATRGYSGNAARNAFRRAWNNALKSGQEPTDN